MLGHMCTLEQDMINKPEFKAVAPLRTETDGLILECWDY